MEKEILYELIPKGRENRITGRELGGFTGYSGQKIRAIINALRTDGKPIASDENGYWIATTSLELFETVHSLTGRINAIARARDGLRDAMLNLILEEVERDEIHD